MIGTGECAAEERFGEGHLHRLAEEADSRGGIDASRSREDLQRHVRAVELDDLRERRARAALHLGYLVVLHALGAKRGDGPRKGVDSMIDFAVEHSMAPVVNAYYTIK